MKRACGCDTSLRLCNGGRFIAVLCRLAAAALSMLLKQFETARNVSFTCSVVENSRATSGSRTTTLVPSAYLAACLPRTPLLKSYSGRILSLSRNGFRLICFFIAFPFSPCRSSCAYDSNFIFTLRVGYNKQLLTMRHANIDKAIFRILVIWICNRN